MAKRIEVDARIRAKDTLGDVNDAVQTSTRRGVVDWSGGLVMLHWCTAGSIGHAVPLLC